MNFFASSGCLDRPRHAGEFDMEIMPFGKSCRFEIVLLLRHHMIGRRGRVGQNHVGLALHEEAIGFRPPFGEGDDARFQLRPGLPRLIAIDLSHPQHETEAGGAGARILQNDLRSVGVLDQLLQASWVGWRACWNRRRKRDSPSRRARKYRRPRRSAATAFSRPP